MSKKRSTSADGHLFGALALVSVLMGSCTPVTVSFELFGREKNLTETVVSDDGRAMYKVAVIDIQGTIVDANLPPFFSRGGNPVDDIVARLEMASRDATVKAVVLRINSPGGSVTGSDEVYREIIRFRERTGKPVVISMAEVAASGGYYVALAGDKIVAHPTTITGSIGVIIPTINFSAGLAKIGIVARSVKSGPNKDLANPLEPMRDSQYAILQNLVDQFYDEFKAKVKERRPNLDAAKFGEMTDGRIVSGRDALALGLVDSLGGVREAFDEAKSLANIPSAKMVKYQPEGSVRPRTPYASADELPLGAGVTGAPGSGASAGGTEINMLQVNASGLFPNSGPSASCVYYLWLMDVP
ncbi:MAG: signal peptide peptidase SppA [Planctomycetes bacterium]|nr:signal peptide peptidase SppA [Planctomycetota bacterium]